MLIVLQMPIIHYYQVFVENFPVYLAIEKKTQLYCNKKKREGPLPWRFTRKYSIGVVSVLDNNVSFVNFSTLYQNFCTQKTFKQICILQMFASKKRMFLWEKNPNLHLVQRGRHSIDILTFLISQKKHELKDIYYSARVRVKGYAS